MMKASELRIGSLVMVSGKVRKVAVIKPDAIHCRIDGAPHVLKAYSIHRFGLDKVEPIPLTEEWLVKFGFEKLYSEYTKGDLMIENEYTDKGVWNVSIGKYQSPTDMLFVHQLQNLFFALTGKELEIK